MDEKNQLNEKELEAVNGGNWSDFKDWFKSTGKQVKPFNVSENSGQTFTASKDLENDKA